VLELDYNPAAVKTITEACRTALDMTARTPSCWSAAWISRLRLDQARLGVPVWTGQARCSPSIHWSPWACHLLAREFAPPPSSHTPHPARLVTGPLNAAPPFTDLHAGILIMIDPAYCGFRNSPARQPPGND